MIFSENEIEISIQELVFRVAAITRSSMSHVFADFLIGYGWQIDEEVFLTDVQGYVGYQFEDGDILDQEVIEEMIHVGLENLENFMLDFYQVNYVGENQKGEEVEFTGSLKECIEQFDIPSFKKQWTLEELKPEWKGYDDYIFNETESETDYETIFQEY